MPDLDSIKYHILSIKQFIHNTCLAGSQAKYIIHNTKHRRSKGFTLIELLIVMTIIALLVAAASASWTNAQQKGRDGRRKSDLKGIQQTLELYFQQNGHYPQSSNGKVQCPGSASAIEWGKNFTCDGTTYMNPIPKDPVNSSGYTYYFNATFPNTDGYPLKYTISAKIENDKDPDIKPENLTSCTPQSGGYNYCVNNP